MVDTKKLEYFIAVAEELHFGRAAERVGIAQPPLSRQIQALEEELKTQLFIRGRSSISLTQAGERFYGRVVAIMSDLVDAQIEARRIAQGAEGRLRIGFVGTASYGILPTIIKSFRQHYKDVSLSLTPMNNAALKRALIRQEIDIAIARPLIDDPEVHSQKLVSEPLILAVPDSDPLSSSEQISPRDLGNSILVLYPERPRPSFADHVLQIASNMGVEPKKRVFTMDFQSAIALVSVSEGISVVPASVGDSARPGVRFVKLDAPDATTGISVNYRIDNQSIFVHNFSNIAAQVARRTLS